jgi:hypothetical protein
MFWCILFAISLRLSYTFNYLKNHNTTTFVKFFSYNKYLVSGNLDVDRNIIVSFSVIKF